MTTEPENQPNLFDFQQALALRDEGVARVDSNADPLWKKEAAATILRLAATFAKFTSDDVWKALEGRALTPEPRAMGAQFLKASKAGVIEPTGEYWQSKRPECHGRRIAVWVGKSQL